MHNRITSAYNAYQKLIVVTGVQAAGKTTVANALAKQFQRSVHIEADILQMMIVSGAVWPNKPGPMETEAAAQLRLRLKNMCLLGKSFFEAGFTVILDDIIIGERLGDLKEELEGYEYSLVVLAPSVDKVLARDMQRDKRNLGLDWALYLNKELETSMKGQGIWIDNSDQTIDETVESILSKIR